MFANLVINLLIFGYLILCSLNCMGGTFAKSSLFQRVCYPKMGCAYFHNISECYQHSHNAAFDWYSQKHSVETVCAWKFRNDTLWDTLEHVLLHLLL